MLFVKVIGFLFLCSVGATDMITFKPFLKSRYSLRERRAKTTTTKAPLVKLDETTLSFSSTEAESQSASTQSLTELLETTKVFTENQLQNSFDTSTAGNPVSTITPTTMETELLTSVAEDKIVTSTSGEVLNPESVVTEKTLGTVPPTTRKMETTTQTEWLYDYYASDDDGPRREASA